MRWLSLLFLLICIFPSPEQISFAENMIIKMVAFGLYLMCNILQSLWDITYLLENND